MKIKSLMVLGIPGISSRDILDGLRQRKMREFEIKYNYI